MPLHTRHRAIEAVLNEILGLHNKPKAVVHSVHKLTGPKKKNICGSSVRSLLHVTLPVSIILKRLLDFCKICVPLLVSGFNVCLVQA